MSFQGNKARIAAAKMCAAKTSRLEWINWKTLILNCEYDLFVFNAQLRLCQK